MTPVLGGDIWVSHLVSVQSSMSSLSYLPYHFKHSYGRGQRECDVAPQDRCHCHCHCLSLSVTDTIMERVLYSAPLSITITITVRVLDSAPLSITFHSRHAAHSRSKGCMTLTLTSSPSSSSRVVGGLSVARRGAAAQHSCLPPLPPCLR